MLMLRNGTDGRTGQKAELIDEGSFPSRSGLDQDHGNKHKAARALINSHAICSTSNSITTPVAISVAKLSKSKDQAINADCNSISILLVAGLFFDCQLAGLY